MKRNKLVAAMVFVYILLFPFSCLGQDDEIAIFKDKKYFFTEYKTIIRDGRLMFSLKDISRLIGGNVAWQQEQNTAVISYEGQKISFTLGRDAVQIDYNGKTNIKSMDTKPVIVNGRMYIPMRFVSEISGFQVSWDNQYNQVFIESTKTNKDEGSKKIPIKIVKASSGIDNAEWGSSPVIPVHYSHISKNLEEIISYIRNYIDKNFDIKNFEVETNVSYIGASGEFSATVSMKYKSGNFIFDDGYKISVNNGYVDTIFTIGNPHKFSETERIELAGGLDPKWLVDLAIENIDISDGYDIVEQTIFEKYDTETYYVVRIVFEKFNEFSYVGVFEYRIE